MVQDQGFFSKNILLEGKSAIVTGSSRGIGRAVAIELARQGCDVLVNYSRNQSAATEVQEEIIQQGRKSIIFQADVGNLSHHQPLIEAAIDAFGKVDLLVNNAGIMLPDLLTMVTDEELDQQINLNIKGVLYCMQHAVRMMTRQESGKIINLSSIIGRFGTPGHAAYAATKGAVISMTLSAAKELGTCGITVNCIAPGIVKTDLIADIKEDELKQITRQIALNRIGQPRDIANVVLFLSSSLSDYISGQIIGVDGCYSM